MGFPNGSVGKESACNARDTGDLGMIPGSERSPGEGNRNPIQYSCLKNPMGRGAWRMISNDLQRIRQDRETKHTYSIENVRQKRI